MTAYHLAQLNIARLNAPLDSPEMAEFVALLTPINAQAERAPGFVWRFQTEDGDATAVRPYADDRILVNFSVWESPEALYEFVYRSDHVQVMALRRKWFSRMSEAYAVLWWVPAGHLPTVQEAVERLDMLRAHGESPNAFTFKRLFPPPAASSDAMRTARDAQA